MLGIAVHKASFLFFYPDMQMRVRNHDNNFEDHQMVNMKISTHNSDQAKAQLSILKLNKFTLPKQNMER
jgi:hypothetical protein